MPLCPVRRTRFGVIAAPVARTASADEPAAVVAVGVDRRRDRRPDRLERADEPRRRDR